MPQDVLSPNASDRRWLPAPTARTAALAVLIALTSMAVGATTSPWLVPPYLVAMGWLLLAPSANRPETSEVLATAPAERLSTSSEPISDPVETPVEPAEIPVIDESPKPRKKRSRAKGKTKAKIVAQVERSEATWVQVAPGKFVRVEVPIPPPTEAPDAVEVGPPEENLDANPAEVDSEPNAPTEGPGLTDGGWEETLDAPLVSPFPEEIGEHEGNPTMIEPGPVYTTAQGVPQPEEPREDVDPTGVPIGDRDLDGGDAPVTNFGETAVRSGPLVRRDPPAFPRSWRLRRDPRPRLRRATGRVGATPRVTLNRS